MLGGTDDAVLLGRIARRDEEAFQLAYKRHARAVMNVAVQVSSDVEAATEITQGTFLKLWQNAPKLDPRLGRLRAWLVTVARHAALDAVRRQRRCGRSEEFTEATGSTAAEDTAEQAISRLRSQNIRHMLLSLSSEQRSVIQLAYFGGLTQEEIARALSLPLGTVKSRLRLGMQHLRRLAGGSADDAAL